MTDECIATLIERSDRHAAVLDRHAAERERLLDERAAERERLLDERAAERERLLIERMERSEQHFIDALAENTAEISRLAAGHAGMLASLAEIRESIRANTQAVLSVLDRLDGFEGSTP